LIVYSSHSFSVDTEQFLQTCGRRLDQLSARSDHDAIVDLFVDVGEVESAVADALQPYRDDDPPALQWWTALGQAAADAVCASAVRDGAKLAAALTGARAATMQLSSGESVRVVRAKTAEGFAHYALYPAQYIASAHRLIDEYAPSRLGCVGIRSIGTPLSHLVASVAARAGISTAVRTVRPRGHPFDRTLALGDRLRRWFEQQADSLVAVIDEGPGLSGSSFAAVVDTLRDCGVPDDRIVLLGSWLAPDSALRSDRGQHAWRSHNKIAVSFESAVMHDERLFSAKHARVEDWSAGGWRGSVFGVNVDAWPAVQPQHERRKYLNRDDGTVIRFAGLGRYGRAKLARANAIADSGFGTEPIGLAGGFLEERRLSGPPLSSPAIGREALDRIARYVAFVRRTFSTGAADDLTELHEMIRVNVGEGCGSVLDDIHLHDTFWKAGFAAGERIAIDGRMMPHEWIQAPAGIMKTDNLDHHADDFFPGSRDIAWDVAGAIVELDLTQAAAAYFVDRYRMFSADAWIDQRLPFYEIAYLAYRVGYTTLAAETLGGSRDGAEFTSLRERYRRLLAARAAVHRPVPRR
jgi:hypothetical protein